MLEKCSKDFNVSHFTLNSEILGVPMESSLIFLTEYLNTFSKFLENYSLIILGKALIISKNPNKS